MSPVCNILFVQREDNCSRLSHEVRKVCQKANIFRAENIPKAHAYIEKSAIDLAVLDWSCVDDRTAYSLSQNIQKHHPKVILIAIILEDARETIRQIFQLRYFDFIRKPIRSIELEVRLMKAIRVIAHFKQVREENDHRRRMLEQATQRIKNLKNKEKVLRKAHDLTNLFFLVLMECFRANLKRSEAMADFVFRDVDQLTHADFRYLLETIYLEMKCSIQLIQNINIWSRFFMAPRQPIAKEKIEILPYIASHFSEINVNSNVEHKAEYKIAFDTRLLANVLNNLNFICCPYVMKYANSLTLSINSTEDYIYIFFTKPINQRTIQLLEQIIACHSREDLLHTFQTNKQEIVLYLAIYILNTCLKRNGGYLECKDNQLLYIYLPKTK